MTYQILHYKSIGSTNDLAKELAQDGAREGLVIWSDHQSKGHGRFKRKWTSVEGKDLLFSILLRPKVKNSQASMVTFIAARVVRDVLKRQFDLPVTIKKPNDVMVNGKKICGILTEASSFPNQLNFIVVGIGINVNSKKKEMLKRAESILELTKQEQNREALLKELLVEFKKQYRSIIKA